MENQTLEKVSPKEFGLDVEQASTIEQAFLPKIQERDALVSIYENLIKSELSPDVCKQAKEVRLKLVKVRTGIADVHKTQKAFFLAAGRFVDAWKNKETLPVEQMEAKLSEIENYYINLEKERVAKLQLDRLVLVGKYTDSPAPNLGEMSDDVFNAYLTGCKVAYDAKIEAEKQAENARIEAERKTQLHNERRNKTIRLVEYIDNYESLYFGDMEDADFMAIVNGAIEKRTAHEAEQARIKAENERLQKEAERKEKEHEAERKKQADILAKQQAEAKKIQDEKDAENAKLKADLKAKEEKEAAELKAKQAAERKAANAPDKTKLIELAAQIEALKMPDINTDVAKQILADVKTLLGKVTVFIHEKSETL
jgi:hypothetical protein